MQRKLALTCGAVWVGLIIMTFGISNNDDVDRPARVPMLGATRATNPPPPVSDESPSDAHTTAPSTTANVSTQPRCPNAVLGAFVRSDGFYKHREVPDYSWVVVFVKSALAHTAREGPSCTTVVLFVDPNTAVQLPPFGAAVEIVKVSHESHPALFKNRWAVNVKNAANNFRFALYRDWLRQHQYVRRVMMTDVTDVVFQADPFLLDACLPKRSYNTVIFTLENPRANFKSERYNRMWMKCFGRDVLDRLAERTRVVSCAGVTFGDRAGVLAYCDAIIEVLGRPAILDCSERVVRAALDQAAHNVLLYGEAGTDDYRFRRATGQSNCTFHGNYGAPRFDGDRLVDAAGNAFAVVHQYTSGRIPKMMDIARARYLA